MTTLTEIRARVRTDLHDEDAAGFRWASAELDRHIFHALREMSLAIPVEDKATLSATAGSPGHRPLLTDRPRARRFRRVPGRSVPSHLHRVPGLGRHADPAGGTGPGPGRAGRGLLRQAPHPGLPVLDRAPAPGRHTGDGGIGVCGPQHVRVHHQPAEYWRRLGVAGLHDMGPGAVERLLSGAGEARSAPTDEISPPEPTPGDAQRRTKWCCSSRDRQCMSSLTSTTPENS